MERPSLGNLYTLLSSSQTVFSRLNWAEGHETHCFSPGSPREWDFTLSCDKNDAGSGGGGGGVNNLWVSTFTL